VTLASIVLVLASTFPLIPGVDWSRDAVAGFFTGPSWTEPCTITAREVAGGYALEGGGVIARGQRFVGCIPGTHTPVFQ
jgi:hypothetical protein